MARPITGYSQVLLLRFCEIECKDCVTHRYGNAMYNKLFSKIVDSSIWLAPDPVRIVWITFLAVMDEDGMVMLPTVANVAHRARVTLEDAENAMRVLESPEPSTATDDDDGRRVEKVPGGWIVLNAKKYRDMATREIQRESTRLRVARHRAKKAGNDAETGSNAGVTPESRSVTQSEAETDTKAGKSGAARPAIDWSAIAKLEQEAWAIWLAWRRKSKFKSYVDTKMATRLAAYPPEIQLAAIEESMTQNWQGLFPEKVKPNGAHREGSETAYEQAGRRLREWADKHGVTLHPTVAA